MNAAKISAAPAITTRRLSAMKSKIEPVVIADGVPQVAERVLKDTGFLAIYGPFKVYEVCALLTAARNPLSMILVI
jgi:hypothetical protein